MLARDVMTTPVITARAEDPVLQIVDLMMRHHISAVPIVDGEGYLIGIVSEGDLVQRDQPGILPHRSWWLCALGGKGMEADEFLQSQQTKATDVMTHKVVTAQEDTPLWQIAETLERKRVKRLPIIAEGKVVGIVSRANLLQAVSAQRAVATESPTQVDRYLREKLVEVLHDQAPSDASHLNTVVRNGVVYFWGLVSSDDERDALIEAAKNVPGVADVVDHMQTK